jgi:hypothetical protein
MTTGYLQHARDRTITLEAIKRLSAELQRPFTYTELADEIERHDGLKIDPRGYAGALDAVAQNLASTEPLWTVMVVNAETGEPGEGFWRADYSNLRYRMAAGLSDTSRAAWLDAQHRWCIAAAHVHRDQLDQRLRDQEAAARDQARDSLIELMLRDRQGTP